MGSIQDAIEIISREVELQEPSSSADFNRQIIVWLTELQELRQSTVGISARSKIMELSKICDTHGHLKKFPWDRGYSEGYMDAIAMVLGYIEQESEV